MSDILTVFSMPVALRTADIHRFSGYVAGFAAVAGCVLYMRKHTSRQRFCADVSTVLTCFEQFHGAMESETLPTPGSSYGALAPKAIAEKGPKFRPSRFVDSSMIIDVHAPKVHGRAGIVFHRVSQQERRYWFSPLFCKAAPGHIVYVSEIDLVPYS